MQTTRIIRSALITTLCATAALGENMTLKEAFSDHFYIGAAISRNHFNADRAATREIAARHFNSITPENEMKWQRLNPSPGAYHFEDADNFVRFGSTHNMYTVGHVLFWHNQAPAWLFEDEDGNPATREVLLDRMRTHVRTLVQRYGNQVQAWDVVNEAFTDNGALRKSNWTRILGDDFIEQAFRIAEEELPPDVEMLYNDYAMTIPAKRDAVVNMVRDLQSKGIRIDGVGMQGHWARSNPNISRIERSIRAFAGTGVHVHITELDIDVLPRHPRMWAGNADIQLQLQQDPKMDPYTEGLSKEMQAQLTARYESIFRLFLKHTDKIRRVTFWGVTDADSWLNNWPIRGRTSHPLLFDRQNNPKPAFHAIRNLPAQTTD